MLYHSLNFASDVAYYVNILNDEDNAYFEINYEVDIYRSWSRDGKRRGYQPIYTLSWYDSRNENNCTMYLPKEVALFILMDKALPGGLCTPMQRRLAYKAIERRNYNA